MMDINTKYTIIDAYRNLSRFDDDIHIEYSGKFKIEQTTNVLLEKLQNNIDNCIRNFIIKSKRI